jgi:hypothetical protein
MPKPSPLGCAAVLLLALAGLLALFALLNRRDELVGLGAEIHFDDFGFIVHGASSVPSVGPGPAEVRAEGMFLVLEFEAFNHARSVDFHLADVTTLLVDATGEDHPLSRAGQAALDAERGGDPCAAAIPPGGACATQLVFDVPPDAGPYSFRVSMGGNGLLDLIDDVFWGRKGIELGRSIGEPSPLLPDGRRPR